ncbi:hypothetical protein JANAI62_06710 [Jannaschia pagri]|uniref:Polyhydroxybutyrate depolymerase n=1 Tax=Jannaschia pagri TaxID=2829797 RepID=A0ABQ4NHY3_9RHOB|nr:MULTISPECIES: polyhydroxybutyrate depolymerase [unclassified Jannaschia]GIT89845.1 hypothetical protein JANAI61_03030 [Jannaschia sp. AI_61]GIT94048.1 hypothetical protein JANAI62_06710 [Jannaschia sp. AI_62]
MRSILLSALLPFLAASQAAACAGEDACRLGDRTYQVREPAGWDGVTPLPVMLHFHGWGRQGIVPVQSPRTGQAADAAGVLFVAPDGLGRTWDFRRSGSRDTPFAEQILAQIEADYPTTDTLIVSGYSWGALMAARFACETSAQIDALLLIAGAFSPSIECAGQPDHVAQVHGLTDTVLDFPFGPNGEQTYATALWRDRLACGEETDRHEWQAVSWLTHERHAWTCALGSVTMDVHSASHLIPRGWVAQVLGEVLPEAPPAD